MDCIVINYTTEDAIADGTLTVHADDFEVMGQLFPLGRVVLTRRALRIDRAVVVEALERHAMAEWGLGEHDRHVNFVHLAHGGDIYSVHYGANGEKFCVNTDASRTLTTVCLPFEYWRDAAAEHEALPH